MDLLANLGLGFGTAFSPVNIVFCFIGVLLGTLIGVLPGIGPTATIAMLLPLTFALSPAHVADHARRHLLRRAVRRLDDRDPGQPARRIVLGGDRDRRLSDGAAGPGRARRSRPPRSARSSPARSRPWCWRCSRRRLTAVALEFGPAEYFSLMVLGLISSVALAHGSVLKALAMIVLGLLLGLVGTDIYTGEQRFTLGRLELADGINFVAVAVGVFGIAEILRNLENEHDRDVPVRHVSGLMPSREDLRRIAAPVLRGTVLGSLLGILPGGGQSSPRSPPIPSRRSSRRRRSASARARSRAWRRPRPPTTPARRPPSSRC